jgi:hypothetical protein
VLRIAEFCFKYVITAIMDSSMDDKSILFSLQRVGGVSSRPSPAISRSGGVSGKIRAQLFSFVIRGFI